MRPQYVRFSDHNGGDAEKQMQGRKIVQGFDCLLDGSLELATLPDRSYQIKVSEHPYFQPQRLDFDF